MAVEILLDTDPALRTVKALRRLPTEIRREIAKVLRTEAKAVARGAKAIVRDPGIGPVSRSGRLVRSIRVRAVPRSGGLTFRVLSLDHPSRGPIALWLEQGTTTGGRLVRVDQRGRERRGRVGGRQRGAPKPFLTLAATRRRNQTAVAVGNAIDLALQAFGRANP